MTNQYDIIVIGAGSAGLSTALFTAKAGLKTLLIDKSEQNLGGDCLNWGCVPSKALLHIARILHSAGEATQFGLSVSGKPDIKKIRSYIKNAQAEIRQHENSGYLTTQGIDVVLGEACFSDQKSIQVGRQVYSAPKIVLATGSLPARPTISGIEKVRTFDNESVFDIRELPSRILVIGAGPVGVEMAQAFRRLSCEVILIGRNEKILPGDPKEITDVLESLMVQEGITIHKGTEVSRFISPDACTLIHPQRVESTIQFDAVFLATGRTFDHATLHLDRAGVEVENGRIKNDSRLRTTNPHVFVCGDVAGRQMFSHAAEQHARVLLNNFFSPLKQQVEDKKMSWVTFSDPQVATFGLSDISLAKEGTKYQKLVLDFRQDDRATVDNYRYGKLILFVTPKRFGYSRRILGGSMIAPQAGEMIQELILAMNTGLDVKVFFDKIYPYPVASRVNQLIIVNDQEKRLTGAIKRILRFLFRW